MFHLDATHKAALTNDEMSNLGVIVDQMFPMIMWGLVITFTVPLIAWGIGEMKKKAQA